MQYFNLLISDGIVIEQQKINIADAIFLVE